MNTSESAHAWQYTLDLLLQMSMPPCDESAHARLAHGKDVRLPAPAGKRTLARCDSVAHLHIVEHSSDSAITVCWRDATSGCYGEQIWKRVLSRTRSTCALSGSQIHRGDEVFRPWARGCKPVNVSLMILASKVVDPADDSEPRGAAAKAARLTSLQIS
ncbi:DUF3331 domain-containing protein [Paraburkholderia sp. J12]|uniref:DUF3331 domain-containing protein n=1 Tax=Paraburkholderia sp. J12 TaxID=2805432 RepID=UPI002ABE81D4|nr:DUF3331 domain-containing protein [Paraburkholderia sp. J12]